MANNPKHNQEQFNSRESSNSGSQSDSDEEFPESSRLTTVSDVTAALAKFRFPKIERLSKSLNNSNASSPSDGSPVNCSYSVLKTKRRIKRTTSRNKQPPVGIFWDIENCQVPKNISASALVQRIREFFLEEYREAEFLVVCDVRKERQQVMQELHDAQVNLIHVASTSKNAADEKLRQSLRRFAEVFEPPCCVVLISSDVNFAGDLSDLRYRKKIHVILVHNNNVADALILCANRHYLYSTITDGLPESSNKQAPIQEAAYLQVSNLPVQSPYNYMSIRSRLEFLTNNCGGKVVEIEAEEGLAWIRFHTENAAKRAQKRIQGEDVFGNKIYAVTSPLRSYTGRKIKNVEDSFMQPPSSRNTRQQQDGGGAAAAAGTSFSREQKRSAQNFMLPDSSNTFRPIKELENSNPLLVGGGGRSRTPLLESQQQLPSFGRPFFNNNTVVGPKSGPSGNNNSGVGSAVGAQQGNWEFSDDGKIHNFNPPSLSSSTASAAATDAFLKANQPVDLIISNLDPNINLKELKRLLTNMLKEYAMILSLNITLQSDGAPIANIKVNNQQAAQFIISQLHRQKLGYKRIVISYAQNSSPDPQQLKAMVISILQEAPDNCMPLFIFIELLESRYHCTVSVSELNKLKDVCKITDNMGSRMISFTQEIKQSPPPNLNMTLVPYCTIHCANNIPNLGWCELLYNNNNTKIQQTPSVNMSFKVFAQKLMRLLTGGSHAGNQMPLLSFQICYEHEFGEPLPVDGGGEGGGGGGGGGVALEHLISCVPNVEIKCAGPGNNIKFIALDTRGGSVWDEETVLKNVPPALASKISLFCRELVDLLRKTEKCQLLLSKFIPAYHHHFGRQCHVADYGHTKLLDLFESIPHVIQIIGDGTRKLITLTHQAQMRRFTSDLLRVLKVQPSKQITVADYPQAYEKVMGRQFNPVDYGLCTFPDLLDEIPENIIVVTTTTTTNANMAHSLSGTSNEPDRQILISVPKREQTLKEIMRTKLFAMEVIDILKHATNCMMLFNKFIPAYHHHFGHQCRVSDYGFSKLIELFEAIPDIVQIKELPDGERAVMLTLDQSLKVLSTQISHLIENATNNSVPLDELGRLYLREYGYPLQPQVYECDTVGEVVGKLNKYVQLSQDSQTGELLITANTDLLTTVGIKIWALLLTPPHSRDLNILRAEYKLRYHADLPLDVLQHPRLEHVITCNAKLSAAILENHNGFVELTPPYVLAVQLYFLCYANGGCVLFNNLERLYQQYFGKSLRLGEYGVHSLDDLYEKFDFLFFVCGYKKNVLTLNRNLAEHQIALPIQICNPNSTANKKWPPPPSIPPKIVQQPIVVKKQQPPKPDSPPNTPNNASWTRATSTSMDMELNLSIQLPITQNPQLMGDPYDLISPVRHLLPPPGAYSTSAAIATAAAASLRSLLWQERAPPHPTELPMPDKLLQGMFRADQQQQQQQQRKTISPDDSSSTITTNSNNDDYDSGVVTKMESCSHSDDNNSSSILTDTETALGILPQMRRGGGGGLAGARPPQQQRIAADAIFDRLREEEREERQPEDDDDSCSRSLSRMFSFLE